MPTPTNRTPVRVARGTYSNLNSSVTDIQEGEIVYATDQDKLYVKEGSALVSTQATLPVNNAVTNVAQSFTGGQRGAITSYSLNADKTLDFEVGNNFSLTLTANITINNPTYTTPVGGQSGSIFIKQDSTGSRTLSWGSKWKFVGGVAPTLSTAAGSVDRIDYIVEDPNTSIHAVFTGNYS
jgi:hypothetical protein